MRRRLAEQEAAYATLATTSSLSNSELQSTLDARTDELGAVRQRLAELPEQEELRSLVEKTLAHAKASARSGTGTKRARQDGGVQSGADGSAQGDKKKRRKKKKKKKKKKTQQNN